MDEAKRNGTYKEFEKSKPIDTVQWVLDITPPEKLDLKIVPLRLMHILTAAVHTSSVTWLNTMYDLALYPEYHDELRKEIYEVFAAENGEWKKQSLTKLVKMDSFIKESARFHPFQAGTMNRIAMRDYTFSDGTFVPRAPTFSRHHQPRIWTLVSGVLRPASSIRGGFNACD
ncbi:hypothetical protein LTR10_024486 [Elasticomyces elasticus]|nr:hypothetical protein LTR10_024486 [Elasticomyces elasticus]KAK5020574.1 hypothetical protein LTS07_011516 [Exophiala sideris]KAK5022073.1 hypothetical protein LTR13_011480 [Exophiala sideris]